MLLMLHVLQFELLLEVIQTMNTYDDADVVQIYSAITYDDVDSDASVHDSVNNADVVDVDYCY